MLWLVAAQLAAPVVALPDAFARRAWGRFARDPILNHDAERVEIATDRAAGAVVQYQLRLTRTRIGQPATVLWANSRTCPPVRPLIESLPALAAPRPAPPGIVASPTEVIVDGTAYRLEVPTSPNGALIEMSNVGTPLAAWIDRAFAKLAPCWSAVELRVR